MAAETVAVAFARELPPDVITPEQNQRAACDPGKPVTDFFVQLDPEPHHQHSEQRGEEDMPASGEGGDDECLPPAPTLCAGGKDKRKPVSRDRRVKKRNTKAG